MTDEETEFNADTAEVMRMFLMFLSTLPSVVWPGAGAGDGPVPAVVRAGHGEAQPPAAAPAEGERGADGGMEKYFQLNFLNFARPASF